MERYNWEYIPEVGNSQGQSQTQKQCIWWLRPFSRNNNKQNIITSYKTGVKTSNVLLYEPSNMSVQGTNYMVSWWDAGWNRN